MGKETPDETLEKFTKMVYTLRDTQLNAEAALFWLAQFPNKVHRL
jgi:hypothetical protein